MAKQKDCPECSDDFTKDGYFFNHIHHKNHIRGAGMVIKCPNCTDGKVDNESK